MYTDGIPKRMPNHCFSHRKSEIEIGTLLQVDFTTTILTGQQTFQRTSHMHIIDAADSERQLPELSYHVHSDIKCTI